MKPDELCTKLENYQEIVDYIENLLELKVVDDRSSSETLMIFEALYSDMMEHGVPGNLQSRGD